MNDDDETSEWRPLIQLVFWTIVLFGGLAIIVWHSRPEEG